MLELIYSHVTLQTLIWMVPALPMAGALFTGALSVAAARSGKGRFESLASAVSVLSSLLSLAAVVVLFLTLTGFEDVSPSAITGPLFRWLSSGALSVDVGLRVDELSLMIALVSAGVAFLTILYAAGFMSGRPGRIRFLSLMGLASSFVLTSVLADNLFLAFIALEGVGVTTCALVAFDAGDGRSIRSAARTFAMNAAGSAALLVAVFLIFGVMAAAGADPESGIFNYKTMERNGAYFMPVSTAIALLVFAGSAVKSALMPVHLWMQDASEAPWPAFALISAAGTGAAALCIVLRLNFIFALSPSALSAAAFVGAASALLAALMAVSETDIRKIIACSNISQFGFIYVAVGAGAFAAAAFHLVIHAIFKSMLVMASGNAASACGGETDIMRMGGLKRRLPVTTWCFVAAAASLAGLAPLSGFFSIQPLLAAAFARGHTLIWLASLAALGVTAFYAFRAAGSVFFGDTALSPERFKRASEPSVSRLLPVMILFTLTAALGLIALPRCLGGGEMIFGWLSGVLPADMSMAPDGSCGTWIMLAAAALLLSAHAAVLGWLIYAQKRDWPSRLAERARPVASLVSRRYFVEEIYEFLLIRPFSWTARSLVGRGLDRTVLEGIFMDGIRRAAGLAGSLASAAQTGILHHYLLYFLVAAVLVIALVAL